MGVRFNLTDFDAGGLGRTGWAGWSGTVADIGWIAELQCAARRLPRAAALLAPSGVRLLIDHLGGVDPALGLDQPGFRRRVNASGTGRAVVKLSGAFRRSRVPYPHADLDPFVAALLDAFTPEGASGGRTGRLSTRRAGPITGRRSALLGALGPRRARPPGRALGDAFSALRIRQGGPMSRTARIRVAVAGAGMVTRHHLLAWQKLPQVEVVALCARRIANAQARAAEFGVPRGLRGRG